MATPQIASAPALPSMLATLCSLEDWLGPYHPQTLFLLAQVAIAYWQLGDSVRARPLLERSIKDLRAHCVGGEYWRLKATSALKDLLVKDGEYSAARSLLHGLLEQQTQTLGGDHPDTSVTRAQLANLTSASPVC